MSPSVQTIIIGDVGSPAREQPEQAYHSNDGSVSLTMVQQQQQQQQQQIFVSVLQNNLEHLNDFFIDKEEDAIMRLQSLKDSLTLASVSHAEAAAVGDLVQVLHWALLNNAAVLKILKKHDKLTGLHLRGTLLTWLGEQPMSSLEVVEQLVQEVEQLVGNCTTARPSTQQRHPSRPANASSTDVLGPASMPRTPQHASTSDETTAHAANSAAIPEGVLDGPPVAGPPLGSRFAAGGQAQAGPAMAAVAAGNAMLEMTRAALAVWQKIGTNASTPSTVAPFPAPTSVLSVLAQLKQVAPQQQQHHQQGVTHQGVALHANALPGHGAPPQQQQQQFQPVQVSTVALNQGPDMAAITVQQHGTDGQPASAALGLLGQQPVVSRTEAEGGGHLMCGRGRAWNGRLL
ncbi:MAG: hypothetical protein WDW38_008252 [Sanguina aurantia]